MRIKIPETSALAPNHRAWILTTLVFGILYVSPAAVDAAPPTASLTYQRGEEASACPSEQTLKDGVAARLGYDPFETTSDRQLNVTVRAKPDGSGYIARIQMRQNRESDAGTRTLETPDSSCAGLTRAMTFTTSVVIDPSAVGRRTGRPATGRRAVMAALLRVHDAVDRADSIRSTIRRSRRESRRDEQESSRSDAPPPLEIRGGLGGGVALGAGPAPAPTLRLEFEIGRGPWGIRVFGRADRATTMQVRDGAVSVSLISGGLGLCGRIEPLFGCAAGTTGRLQVSAVDLPGARTVGRLYAAAGPALGADIPLTERLAARLQSRAYATLVPTRATVGGRTVWTTPRISGSATASVLLDF